MDDRGSLPSAEPAFGIEAAERLAGELMPVSVAVGGEGAALLLGVLEKAGIAAEAVSGSQAGDAAGEAGAFDLAILLADAAASGNAETSSLVTAMSQASERLIFLPRKQDGALPSMPELNAWFEMFAELGYQPVVDFDAGFLAHGAFLVDRSATAAESELEAFAERLSVDGALAVSTKRVASLEAELAGGDRALQAALDAKEAELAALREENGRLSIQVEQAARRVEAADARAAQAEAGRSSAERRMGIPAGHGCAPSCRARQPNLPRRSKRAQVCLAVSLQASGGNALRTTRFQPPCSRTHRGFVPHPCSTQPGMSRAHPNLHPKEPTPSCIT